MGGERPSGSVGVGAERAWASQCPGACHRPSASPGPVGWSLPDPGRADDAIVAARLRATLPDAATSEESVGSEGSPIAAVQAVTTPWAAQTTLDAFVRMYFYAPAARAIAQQGEALVRAGRMTTQEAAGWVVAQRNALVVATRDAKNSPLGRALSEYLKPRDRLPTVASLMEKARARNPGASEQKILEAIIKGAGETRGWVNRVSVVMRIAGPALVALDLAFSAYVVSQEAPERRGRKAAGQAGRIAGGVGGGWGGAKAGCAGGAAIGVWFEGVGAAPACLVGGVIGMLGLGYAGSKTGEEIGGALYDGGEVVLEWLGGE